MTDDDERAIRRIGLSGNTACSAALRARVSPRDRMTPLRVMVVDTGNNMRAENWLAAADAADLLVVTSTVREDTGYSGLWMLDALQDADAVIVATHWPEFVNYAPADYAKAMRGKVFVDAMNRFDIAAVQQAGLHYVGVGRG